MIKRTMLPVIVLGIGFAACAILPGGRNASAQNKQNLQDQERKVQEAEVPKAALDTLKKLADKAAFTEFAEEIEHGHRFYEASWNGPSGNVDALVTESGDLVEIEEVIPGESVPAAARTEAEKEAGKDVKLMWEKKTVVMYEAHFKKNGKGREIILTPDGRRFHEEKDEKADKDDEDEK